ncbi:sortase A [Nocardioides sp. BE266]|uniref:class E sortase n=1 Tax=Nocardioides sp. BE266 TaxID=2817725 RepID=UPI0028644271|nr:class E sortase [Nocardioides sp. BE266]MDR7251740.1 sortase A [Nocardioides sp. BE266]
MAVRVGVVLAAAAVAATAACTAEEPRRTLPAERRTTSTPSVTTPSPTPSETPSPEPEPERPEPRRSFVSIPAIGLRDFPVVRYRGSPDDAPGTDIQNAGEMASPRGPRGGTGPGEVGNYIVTGHRLTGPAPLRYSPSLRRGDRIRVRTGDTVFVYEIRRTRWTSFRQPPSLRAQRAEVPGRPGEDATRPMITLSTCATLEDHAAGNYWFDQFDNPEHRIDKIGVLVATRPA